MCLQCANVGDWINWLLLAVFLRQIQKSQPEGIGGVIIQGRDDKIVCVKVLFKEKSTPNNWHIHLYNFHQSSIFASK